MPNDKVSFNELLGDQIFFNKDAGSQGQPFNLRKRTLNHVKDCKCNECQLTALEQDPQSLLRKWGFI